MGPERGYAPSRLSPASPAFDSELAYQLSALAHLLAGVVWVGGMLVLALVAVPVARGLPPADRSRLVGLMGRRFLPVAWAGIAILVLTGVANASFRGIAWETIAAGALLETAFGRLLLAKALVVALAVLVSAAHDFAVGPAAVRAREKGSNRADALASSAAWLARLDLLLALMALALGFWLVRGLPP